MNRTPVARLGEVVVDDPEVDLDVVWATLTDAVPVLEAVRADLRDA